jgi:TonB family protein
MKNKRTHISNTSRLNTFSNYLKGKFSNQQRHQFERSVMSDPFEADAFDGLSRLSSKELKHDMQLLHRRLNRKTTKQNRRLWLTAAASVALLIGFISILWWNAPTQPRDRMAILKPDTKEEKTQLAEPTPPQTSYKPSEELSEKKQTTTEIIISHEPQSPIAETDDDVLFEMIEDSEVEVELQEASTIDKTEVEEESKIISKSNQLTTSAVSESSQARNRGISISERPTQNEMLTIKGFVHDTAKEPLSGVTIYEPKTGLGTTSNINGYFELELPANKAKSALLNASFIGYDTYAFQPQTDTAQITLNPNMLALQEVAVVSRGVMKNKSSQTSYTTARPTIGLDNYKRTVIEKLKSLNKEIDDEYRVVVKVIIESSGDVNTIEVLQSPDKSLDADIIKIIRETSTWLPAIENGEAVSDSQRITFRVK